MKVNCSRNKSKLKILSPAEQKEFMKYLIEIDEGEKYSPEDEKRYERMMENLDDSQGR